MNLKRCDKGHFFDVDKFTSCPHCAGGARNLEETIAILPDEDIKTEAISLSKEESNSKVESIGILARTVRQITESVEVNNEEDDAKTVRYYETVSGIEPVVGWLICIDGEEKGVSFNLKGGRNFVGRSPKMDIVLKDSSVSRDKHAVILYEPKRREFIAQPGESRELFYLNDEVVLNFNKLSPYDILQVGNTKLMFIPFCSERFSWEDEKGSASE